MNNKTLFLLPFVSIFVLSGCIWWNSEEENEQTNNNQTSDKNDEVIDFSIEYNLPDNSVAFLDWKISLDNKWIITSINVDPKNPSQEAFAQEVNDEVVWLIPSEVQISDTLWWASLTTEAFQEFVSNL